MTRCWRTFLNQKRRRGSERKVEEKKNNESRFNLSPFFIALFLEKCYLTDY
jgi:hypothetical protein